MTSSSIKIVLRLLHQLQLAIVSYSSASVLDDDVFFSSHSWHASHAFSKFTDQQCRVLNSRHIINTNASSYPSYLLSLHVNMFCGMFVVC